MIVIMKTLFDQAQLKGMKLKNRFVRSETHDETADEQGHMEICNDYFNRYYKSNKN